ncbi:MAG TPA: hypothetical protein VFM96_03940 [Gaiellaceae bacterium]|nr:hypothetical protein [Gaiellaceae bacterium]
MTEYVPSSPTAQLKVGVLYPAHPWNPSPCVQAEDDYTALADLLENVRVEIAIAHASWPILPAESDTAKSDWKGALVALGDPAHLLASARTLEPGRPHVITWACTSASFLGGLQASEEEAASLSHTLGIPVSNTSLAFVAALRALRITRVSVASIYDPEISDALRSFLAEAGIATAALTQIKHAGLDDFVAWRKERLLEIVALTDAPQAEAILIPETGIHTVAWLDELEASVNKPVLTANQVTMWDALQRVGFSRPEHRLGELFRF